MKCKIECKMSFSVVGLMNLEPKMLLPFLEVLLGLSYVHRSLLIGNLCWMGIINAFSFKSRNIRNLYLQQNTWFLRSVTYSVIDLISTYACLHVVQSLTKVTRRQRHIERYLFKHENFCHPVIVPWPILIFLFVL